MNSHLSQRFLFFKVLLSFSCCSPQLSCNDKKAKQAMVPQGNNYFFVTSCQLMISVHK